MPRTVLRCRPGFTLLETVAVLLLLGVLAAAVLSRFSGDTGFEASAEWDLLRSRLRYAQSLAMSSDMIWGVGFTSDSYQLYQVVDNAPQAQPFPRETATSVNLSRMTIFGPPASIAFNGFGTPVDNAGVPLAADTTLTTSVRSIRVVRNTGYIP
ncbi:MAG: prepilin-type N-terminal cleavage/methylation domain-containing protein [Thermodesulfobacteriota bacterium]